MNGDVINSGSGTRFSHKMEAKQRRAVRCGRLKVNSNVTLPSLPACKPLYRRVISGTAPGCEGSLATANFVSRESRRQTAWAASVESHRTPEARTPRKHTPSIRPTQKFILDV